MIRRSLALGLVLVSASLAACGGSEPVAETPEAPPATAPEPAAPANTATPATTAEPTVEKPAEAPAAEPKKVSAATKAVGVWATQLDGEARTKAEAAAKKKAGKDEAKATELMKAEEAKAAQDTVEVTADGFVIATVGGKPVSKSKFEVVSDDGMVLVLKFTGKDEITKKDASADNVTLTFKDEKTVELKSPKATKTLAKK